MYNLRLSSWFAYCTISFKILSSLPSIYPVFLAYVPHKQTEFTPCWSTKIMAGPSLQTKVNGIFRGFPSTNAPEGTSDSLANWEKELIESQQRRDRTIEAETSTNSDSEARDSFVDDGNQTQKQQLPNSHSTSQPPSSPSSPPSEETTSTSVNPEFEPILYLPEGRLPGGTPANNMDEGHEKLSEPVSSSKELIGRFCIFTLVTKFPYKFMHDPNSRVSRRFFASEQVFKRNWNM